MYATGVGLVMIGLEKAKKSRMKKERVIPSEKKGKQREEGSSFFDKIKSWFDEEDVE